MAVTDPIADFLTRIRNAQQASHRVVEIPASKVKKEITKVLYDQGFILKYKFDTVEGKGDVIKIALKYDLQTKKGAITELGRISRPGLRKYAKVGEMPRIINGLGICVVSTNKGIMTEKQARTENVGGELLCYVF
jgi:small subunit ribosomal protein S8